MTLSLFDNTISFLTKTLDMMSRRHQLISSNIANQDTPDYKAKDISFEKELAAALHPPVSEGNSITHPGHIEHRGADITSVKGTVFSRPDTSSGYDNNSVNVEMEMASMAGNTIMYNASAQIISTKLKALSYAIREGR